MLVGGNLAFTVSALPVGTGTSAQGNSDGAADDDIPYPDFAPFSELVDMQNAPAISDGQAGAGNAEDVSGVAENLQDNASLRYTYAYEKAIPGEGRFIHTYKCDGNPLPSFEGEPKLVDIPDDMEAFTELLWNSLNEDNKVSDTAPFLLLPCLLLRSWL